MDKTGWRKYHRFYDLCRCRVSIRDSPRETVRMMNTKIVLASTLCTLLCAPAWAQELTGTLKKIKDSGSITLGHRESSIPFSYYDDKQQVIGYSQEFALKVVDAVKEKLNMPNLKVQQKSVTSQNRLLLVTGNQIDIECG